jgi:hypothetical protein
VHGEIVSCYVGTQACEDSTWGACEEGLVVSHYAPEIAGRLRPRSITDQTNCDYNPCDPNCQIFEEEPDAAIETKQGDPIFVWTSGDLAGYPPGLVNKGLVTPCNSGYDCQFNRECVQPITHEDCAHSKCEPGVALEENCEEAYASKNAPSCVKMICDAMPGCCDASYSGDCDHNPCEVGTPLKETCESCIATLCATEPSCCGAGTTSATDPIIFEVEQYDGYSGRIGTSEWVDYISTSASGGKAMKTPDRGVAYNNNFVGKAARLDFDATFGSAGIWYVWVRGLADGSTRNSSNSCHVGLDGAAVSTSDDIGGFQRYWIWRRAGNGRPYIDVASAGAHTVNLWMREDGFVGDRILLTQDPDFVPTGLGPAAGAPTEALLVAEAEDYTGGDLSENGRSWVERSDSDASGGSYMRAEPDNGTNNNSSSDSLNRSPRLDYVFDFWAAGRWYVFVRGYGPSSNSDSLHVGLNGGAVSTSDRISGFNVGDWVWSSSTMDSMNLPYIDVPSAGTHTVNVWMREDGMYFDKLILTQDDSYEPAGTGPSGSTGSGGGGSIGGIIGIWSDTCVALYESTCGVDCSEGAWNQDCVDAVGTICDAKCGERQPSRCDHSVCTTGDALDARCHPCARAVCAEDPLCCIDEWDSQCVAGVQTYCDATCPVEMLLRPPERGECRPRMPGETDPSCDGIDLAVGVPCEGVIPICNHGTEEAPQDLRVLHFPGNSQQYPKTAPDESHPQMEECSTSSVIPPGHCTNVTDCPGLNGNREIMVNPEGSGVDECSRLDNWSLFSKASDSECEIPVCSESDTTAQFTDTSLYFIMDKSGSMDHDSKWTNSVKALKAFFRSEDAAGIRMSLEFFPLSDYRSSYGDGCGDSSVGECSSGPCSNPMVDPDFLTSATGSSDPQEEALIDALDEFDPGGYTPTYPALDGTLQLAASDYASSPNDFYAAILVTDGDPTKCEESTHEIAKLALDAWLNYGIRTYTIGMEGASISALDTIANAGGTRQAFVVRSGENVEQDLLNALLAIVRATARCEFDVQNGMYINPFDAELTYAPGDGSDPVLLPLVDDEDACGEGWYYDDPNDPRSAALCPDTCDEIQNDARANVSMEIGCAEPLEETEYSQTYFGSCPAGSGFQWGFFTYDSDLEPGAEIRFEARTAVHEDELPDADWVDVITAVDTMQTCGLGGPLPDCPVSLYDQLGGGPAARSPYLELRATLSPNSARTSKATLNSWEITFTCFDAE